MTKKMIFYIIPILLVMMGGASSGTAVAQLAEAVDDVSAVSDTGYKIGQTGPADGFVFYDNVPAPVSQAAPATQVYAIGQNGPAGGFTFYDNVPVPVSQAAPATQVYTIGQNGPAGGFTFYDNVPAPVSQAAPAAEVDTIGQNGPAGGLTFYDNVPATVSQAAPAAEVYTIGQNGPAGGFTFYDNVPVPVSQAVPVNPSVTYRVGDTGPAGGVIFFVNPSSTDGWRYLEAAPASTEVKAAWSSVRADVKGTNGEVGAGKPNTQAIVTHSLNTGDSCRAAMVCEILVSGGYDDWFLPSKSELNLMFAYLKEAGIGGFKDDWYWSSSGSGNENGAWAQRFSDGSQNGYGYQYSSDGYGLKTKEYLVRAIRQF
jgi:hypothetical protein